MVEPGMTLTGKNRYTNCFVYKNFYITQGEKGIYLDDQVLIMVYDILTFYLYNDNLYCITKMGNIIVFDLIRKLLVKTIYTDLHFLRSAVFFWDTIYIITNNGCLYESSIKTLQITRSDYGQFEDKFDKIGVDRYIEKSLVDFDNFIAKFVIHDDEFLYLVDLYNRVYKYKDKLYMIYHHYIEIIDIIVVNGVIMVLDQYKNFSVVRNCQIVCSVAIKRAEKIVAIDYIACRDSIFNLSAYANILFKKDFSFIYYYQNVFYGQKIEKTPIEDTVIDIPSRKDEEIM